MKETVYEGEQEAIFPHCSPSLLFSTGSPKITAHNPKKALQQGDREKPGATPPSHRMSPPFLLNFEPPIFPGPCCAWRKKSLRRVATTLTFPRSGVLPTGKANSSLGVLTTA
jgi:hypothetical protein